MRKLTCTAPHALHGIAETRRIESLAAANLPPHTLMQRAGLAVARLGLALAPHAQQVWVASGPGNNGGDGFEAAVHLQRWGKHPVVTWIGSETALPTDAHQSFLRAKKQGVLFCHTPPKSPDLCIDALLGMGGRGELNPTMVDWLLQMRRTPAPVLAVDLPSGLNAETGQITSDLIANNLHPMGINQCFTLALLTLKPGLFTLHGRDTVGELWFDDLGCEQLTGEHPGQANLSVYPTPPTRMHASHKGSYGDVLVLGGATGMTGAAVLAADAALHSGAGRVYISLLDPSGPQFDPQRPALMFRQWSSMDLLPMTVVCGCGGGNAIARMMPQVLQNAGQLVLDADALNALADHPEWVPTLFERARTPGKQPAVLTPHPLEAARLLGRSTAQVQSDRFGAARALAERFGSTVVLKGSGSIVSSPGKMPVVNPTGNAWLATAGTGDVLAGMIGALLAQGELPHHAAAHAVCLHGAAADRWQNPAPMTADQLVRRLAAITS